MRLIDADALLEKLIKTPRYFDLKFDIDDAPTIDVQVYHARGSKILGNEAELVIDEANAYRGEEMTREEAVEKLEAFAPMVVDDTREAIDMAIEALQREGHLVELEAKAVAIIKSERHGEWKEHTVANAGKCLKDSIQCSVCGYLFCKHDLTRKNYCPNCGAKMDKK